MSEEKGIQCGIIEDCHERLIRFKPTPSEADGRSVIETN